MDFIGTALQVLCYAIVAVVSGIGSLLLVLKLSEPFQHQFFAFVFPTIAYLLKPHLVPFKKQLFNDLDKVESKDPELRKGGLFRMLEIGIGDGSNLGYYPKNCRLISLEPNDNFYKHYEKNRKQYPDLVVEKFVKSVAEDMADIPDGSVDVVVGTYVLCSVQDVDRVLSEVKRVLCQGGQYLLFEHVLAPPNTRERTIQRFSSPFWKTLFAGCYITRHPEEKLKNAGFSKVEVEMASVPSITPFLQWSLLGKAVK